MATTMKGLLKGLRYITQIFDEEEKEPEMQIGLPTDVKHVAHIGSDDSSANQPSWMNDFKAPQPQVENEQVCSKGVVKNQATKLNNTEEKNQTGGKGLQELLPPTYNEKPKHKTRRKSGADSPTRRTGGLSADPPPRHHRSSHSSIDSSGNQDLSSHRRRHRHQSSMDSSSNQDSSNHRRRHRHQSSMDSSSNQDSSSHRRRHHHSVPDMEASYPLTDSTVSPPKPMSRHRKNKGSTGGELPVKNSKVKEENDFS